MPSTQTLLAHGERPFTAPHRGEASHRDALAGFTDLFDPGNTVDMALAGGDLVSSCFALYNRAQPRQAPQPASHH